MSDWYTHGSYPSTGSAATSAAMRAELDLIAAAFNKLPSLSGNNNKILVVNSGGTGVDAVSNLPTLGVTDSGFSIVDNADATKIAKFELAGLSTSTTRTLSVPDASGTIALKESLISPFAMALIFGGA